MRFIILGTGAVGAYLGGSLSLGGHQVVFIARPHTAQVLTKQGLRISSQTSYRRLPPLICETSPGRACMKIQPQAILLTVKAYDVATTARQLKPYCNARIPVLCFANGVGSERVLAERVGPRNVIPATLTTAVQMVAPNEVRIERSRGIGLGGDHPALPSLVQAFQDADLIIRTYPDPAAMKWSKLLTNIIGNASSAILNWPPGAVAADEALFRLELESLREAVRVIHAMHLHVQNLPGVPAAVLAKALFLPPWLIRRPLRKLVIGGRGDKLPSFHYDIGRGRSEVEWLNGAVVHWGEQHHIPTPANRLLTDVMLSLVRDRQEAVHYRGNPQALLSRAIRYNVPGF